MLVYRCLSSRIIDGLTVEQSAEGSDFAVESEYFTVLLDHDVSELGLDTLLSLDLVMQALNDRLLLLQVPVHGVFVLLPLRQFGRQLPQFVLVPFVRRRRLGTGQVLYICIPALLS